MNSSPKTNQFSEQLDKTTKDLSLLQKAADVKAALPLDISNLSELVQQDKYAEIMKVITEAKANFGWSWDNNSHVRCAMREAILSKKSYIVGLFLDEKVSANGYAHVEGTSGSVEPFIYFAAKAGHLETVKLLVTHKAIISPRNEYYKKGDNSGIKAAVLAGHTPIAEYLLEHGAEPNGVCTYEYFDDRTLFIAKAAEERNIPLVEVLLKYGAEILSALYLEQEKFEKNYKSYTANIERNYSDQKKQYLIEGELAYHHQFRENYDLIPDVKMFFKKNIYERLISSLEKLDATTRNDMISKLHKLYEKHSIKLSKDEVTQKFEEQLVNKLKKFDSEKEELEKSRENFQKKYYHIVKTLLDYAAGIDFPVEEKSTFSFREFHGLTFLKYLDVSDFCFVGTSINGKPITREMLIERGLKGADKALVCINDLKLIQEASRREKLNNQLKTCIQAQGGLISSTGIINLIPLWRAAEIGDIAAVEARLKAGVDPNNNKDEKKRSPIVLAARNGHLAIVKLLASHPRINKKIIINALEQARENKHAEIVSYLSDQQDINDVDESGQTLLHKAVVQGDVKRVQDLIRKSADVNLCDNQGDTPLSIAASIDDSHDASGATIVEILLKNNANPNQFKWVSPLSCAVKSGNIVSLALLLPCTEKKEIIRTDWNNKEKARDPWYTDMMFEALRKKKALDILVLLKKHGASFNTRSSNGNTLLNSVIVSLPSFSSIKRTMQDLVRGGYNRWPEAMSKTEDDLTKKARKYFEESTILLNFLLNNGADVKLSDSKEGYTPLHLLIKETDLQHIEGGYEELLTLFIKKGADVNAQTLSGDTPLHEAAETGDRIAIEALIKNGAAVNRANAIKRTALHQAAIRKFVKTTELLLKLGADPKAVDKDGLTPLQLAEAYHEESKNRYQATGSQKEKQELDLQLYQIRQLFSSPPALSAALMNLSLLKQSKTVSEEKSDLSIAAASGSLSQGTKRAAPPLNTMASSSQSSNSASSASNTADEDSMGSSKQFKK